MRCGSAERSLVASVLPSSSFPVLLQLALALAIGLLVGLERERRGEEAGLRTFGLVALLGALGGLMRGAFAPLALGLASIIVIFLNLDQLRRGARAALTTSAAMFVTAFAGALCGLGMTLVPVAIGIVTAALLAWKERLESLVLGLTDAEVQSAILLGLLAFVIYPVLPPGFIDPWGLVDLQEAWLTVILIAAIGFANYILLKLYGGRAIELAGFLGGFVNSDVTVVDLARRIHVSGGHLIDVGYRGILLTEAAMVIRNLVILGIFSWPSLIASAVPLLLILVSAVGLALSGRRAPRSEPSGADPVLQIRSPFSLIAALEFGLIFLALQVAGGLAERALGPWGFYATSLAGGAVSSASAVASAATLAARGAISPATAGIGAVLASLASMVADLPLAAHAARDRRLMTRLLRSFGLAIALGLLGVILQVALVQILHLDLVPLG